MTLIIESTKGTRMTSIEDWHINAPPKDPVRHWKDGRSAKELARAWCGSGTGAIPRDLAELLETHPATAGFSPELGIPELVTPLDDFRGEARNHDLVVVGTRGAQRILLGIEAKADEPLGIRLSEIRSDNPRSKRLARLDLLARAILGHPVNATVAHLRYQLLTGIAGSLIEARRRQASAAVFIVHVFRSAAARPARVAHNAAALEDLLAALGGTRAAHTTAGWLTDPLILPGGPFVPGDLPLILGTLTTGVTLLNENA
jgi:hypothetical protein